MVHPSTSVAAVPATRVLFFGKVGDCFGRAREVMIPREGCSVAALKRLLADQVEGGQRALAEPGVRSAVGREMTLDDGAWIRPDQEVAFFSAFSGG